jgi:hypothetical protein
MVEARFEKGVFKVTATKKPKAVKAERRIEIRKNRAGALGPGGLPTPGPPPDAAIRSAVTASMCKHILIATDGSELAEKAVADGPLCVSG